MVEHIVQMGPMLALAGLMTAWVAEAVSRAGGYGFMPDMGVGVSGSVIVGGLVWSVAAGRGLIPLPVPADQRRRAAKAWPDGAGVEPWRSARRSG